MTLARLRRKAWIAGIVLVLTGRFAGAEPVAIGQQSGLAISGFDPVAYFTDSTAKIGYPEWEYNSQGVTWRFRSEGNRAAFAERPDVYAPRFGGYDPVAVARGTSVPGHPQIWLVSGERLYLFYDAKARAAFVADPIPFIEAAERKWPTVQRTLP
ncbi:MAG: hypothetical protein JO205_11640 [Pseudolabrys sp.]|nr:hypothetical protein [Pseudolabrys sp.]